MSISEIAIKRPVFTTMITLGWVVLGLLGFSRLGTDLYPDVKFPFVTIVVPYPGAAPADVERQVVKPLEDAVVAVNGVDRVEGFARDNVGVIAVVFKLDTDFETAAADVRDKIDAARGKLPDGVKEPIISKADIGASPILVYAANAPRPSEEVRKVTEDQIKPALEKIPGVAKVDVLGGREREIQVELDPVKLEGFGLSPLAVAHKLRAENATIPGGHYASGVAEIGVRTVGEFRSVEEVREAVVFAGADGKRVRAGDLGEVVDGFKEQRTLIRANGSDAVAFQIVKTSDANTVTVAHAVKEELAKVSPRLPKDFETSLLIDQSTFIEENAHEVEIAIVFGGAMAILIILFFMMDLRSTFISALALPTSVIGTFLLMYVMGFTLNMMTLLALSLAIGLLIDDAVVVRENIFRHLEMGEDPETAAARGTSEIGLAVLATTMTIVAVFVPVAFMEGIVGQFFRQFGLTVTAAVLLSMAVAFTLDPMLSARLAKKIVHGAEAEKPGRVRATLTRGFERMDAVYKSMLGWTVVHPKTVVAGAFLSFAGAIGIAGALGNEFLTPEDRGQFILNLEFPPETSLAETSARSLDVEKKLLADSRFKTVYTIVGPESEVNKAKYRVNVAPKNERPESLEELKTLGRRIAETAPGVKVTAENPPMIEGLGTWSPIQLAISGPSYEVLAPTAEKIAAELRSVKGAADVKIDYTPGKEELQVLPDRGRAGAAGVPMAVVGMNVRVALDGDVAGKLRTKTEGDDDETDVRVRLAAAYRNDPARIATIPLPAAPTPEHLSSGAPLKTIRLGDIAAIEPGIGPSVIHRQDRLRTIVISATTADRPLGSVVAEFKPRVAALVPEGYTATWLGNVKDMEDSNAAFGMALGVAILFIYIVLASQFESFVHPATIMLSLPLAMVGAMGGLWIYGAAISMGAQIGIILLMGLVTKNAILLVDAALVHVREGMSPKDAMLAAGPKRLRPILMTSAAMVLGMLPTALSNGSGSEFRAPMAVAVIGGVISSTVLTLIVVPVVFLFVEALRARAAAFVTGASRLEKLAPRFAATVLALAVAAAAMLVLFPATAGAAENAAPASGTALTLEKAMQLADETSPDLAIAAEKVEQSQADVRSAYAGFLPQVVAQGNHLWHDEAVVIRELGPVVLPEPIVFQENTTWAAQVQGTWPLLNPQAFPTLAAAKHGRKATAAAYAQGRQELFYGVAQAFWAVAVTDRLVAAADEAVANAAELSRVANEQVKAEVATNLALLRARTAEQQAKQSLLAAKGARGAAEAALRRLTGIEGPITIVIPPNETPAVPDESALWKSAQEKRHDLQSAREAIEAREDLVRAAKLSYLPVIAGQGTYYQTSTEGLTGKTDGYNGGLVAQWTILDGGLREARIKKARSQEREAIAQSESQLRKAREEVSRASLDLATALATRAAAQEAAQLAKEAQALAQTSYRAGTATNLEVTQANATLLQAQAGLAQAEAQAALASLSLKKVTGEPLH